jgi:hypothetical protein
MSAKSVAEKLLIKPGTTLWSSHPDRLGLIEPLPSGVRTVEGPEQATTALVFADDADALRELLAAHGEQLTRPDILWVAYPKANRTDINRDTLWPILAKHGIRPIGQVADISEYAVDRLSEGRRNHLVPEPVVQIGWVTGIGRKCFQNGSQLVSQVLD